jgi:hypothetical protein
MLIAPDPKQDLLVLIGGHPSSAFLFLHEVLHPRPIAHPIGHHFKKIYGV